jgi:hypothetical protein
MSCLCHAYRTGGENGFNQAIELSADMLSNVKFVQEKRLISKFFDEISQDTGKFVFSVKVGVWGRGWGVAGKGCGLLGVFCWQRFREEVT